MMKANPEVSTRGSWAIPKSTELVVNLRLRKLKLMVIRYCSALDWSKSRAILSPNRIGRVMAFYRFGEK